MTNRENRHVNETKGKRRYPTPNGKEKSGRNKKNPKPDSDQFVPENKVYPPQIWTKLSYINKQKVRALYEADKSNNPQNRGNNTNQGQ